MEAHAGSAAALWQGMGDDSRVMALLSQKLLEKAAERRRRLGGGPKGQRKGVQRELFEELSTQGEGPPGTEMMRIERQRVVEAVKASGIDLQGAWEVPSAFEAEWRTEEWCFDEW